MPPVLHSTSTIFPSFSGLYIRFASMPMSFAYEKKIKEKGKKQAMVLPISSYRSFNDINESSEMYIESNY